MIDNKQWISKHWKNALFILALVFLLFMIIMSLINPPPGPPPQRGEWQEQMKPAADEFLMLLKDGDVEALINKYCKDSFHGRDEIAELIEKSREELGWIESFKFKRSGTMGFPGKYTLSMYYRVAFDSGRSHDAVFSVWIDPETNQPIPGRLKRFQIMGNYGLSFLDINLFYSGRLKNKPGKNDGVQK